MGGGGTLTCINTYTNITHARASSLFSFIRSITATTSGSCYLLMRRNLNETPYNKSKSVQRAPRGFWCQESVSQVVRNGFRSGPLVFASPAGTEFCTRGRGRGWLAGWLGPSIKRRRRKDSVGGYKFYVLTCTTKRSRWVDCIVRRR